ncbi:hypothetical protein WN944_016254 [Citrus x changshan-huyou]|uniref:Disease resistance protein n=1 Tax=Citrus x changshan-huyou TaxID=2935761 RepID=A0AAP0M907_9ROSI
MNPSLQLVMELQQSCCCFGLASEFRFLFLSSRIGLLQNLLDCANLDSVSITKDHLSLAILDIRQCPKIVSFPERGLPLATPNLKLFVILDWKILKVIPNLRHSLSFLTELFIQECPKLGSTPGSFPETLRKLSIVSCHKFRPRRDWRLHKLENLRSY